jgi:hypothetical protein
MGTASIYANCGAPVPGYQLDKAGDRANLQDAAKSPPSPSPVPGYWEKQRGCLFMLLLIVNFAAVWSLIGAVVYVVRGSPGPGKPGQDYLALHVSVIWALVSAAIPALTAAGVAARRRVRRVTERRALAPEAQSHYRITQAD